MANAAGLVRAVSKALGIPEATVSHQHRLLREAEKIRSFGRGRGAAAMRPVDAAALLIATATTSLLKDTVESLDSFAGLPLVGRKLAGPDRPNQFGPDELLSGLNADEVKRSFGLGRLAVGTRLDHALGAVIRWCINGTLFPELSAGYFLEEPQPGLNLAYRQNLSFKFWLPVPRVTVSYQAEGILFEFVRFGGMPGEPLFRYVEDVLEPAGVKPCLVEERSFTLASLIPIAGAIGIEGIRAEFETALAREKLDDLSREKLHVRSDDQPNLSD